MKSKFAEKFNHDPIADDYDNNIQNKKNPIRKGYKRLMEWIKDKTKNSNIIIDLGCGTGNTTNQIISYEKVYCVDISNNMLNLAKRKLENKKNITFIESDLLSFFDEAPVDKNIDTIISTYAIHHLTKKEKYILFQEIYNLLPKGGKIIFGDLMFKNKIEESKIRNKYPDLKEDFDDEIYWNIENEVKKLRAIGFKIEIQRFSDLSWGIYGEK